MHAARFQRQEIPLPSSDRIGTSIIPVTRYQQNCCLVWCKRSGAAAVVDPGGELDLILAEAARCQVTIGKILLTHGHLDHAGAAAELSEVTSAPIFGPHRADRFLLEPLSPRGDPAWLDQVEWLADGARVEVGELLLEVRHCPGHTPGHVVFIEPNHRVAWVGDVLFAGSIGNTSSEYGDPRALIQGIVRRLWPYGNDIRFLPGHGRMSTFGAERVFNQYVSDVVVSMLALDPVTRSEIRD